MNFIFSKKAQKNTETEVDYYDQLKAKSAYQRYRIARVDRSHLVKYPQSVEPSDYYLYLKSKVTWS
ncbi:hypothetical protein MUA33_05310 [Staphylococcus delphini]|uniref:hypothetical protein n=1 Tax=Staphylococcus delphini TaxID=53344 RepID=UPI0021D11D1C|nr:hypothetical protein [Staphylococcus delphini]UXS22592.1 hypothetical protein MUA22_05145 [Staphylococcus delphini]UXS30192.1 hypothetical protein MUA33_05310 [Staphylococcus delphini]UXS37865.1 hypothetical protein MUA34_05565 [Staphylococcus delphini]UXS43561.1 hypothetical protein MUA39_09315 [Staphylococcus delphini]UXS43767.1 hypothetical protein MUA39_10435 [Staphylococcus delphini]